MNRWLLPLLPLLLAGCGWAGDAFYAATDAQTAVVAGDYLIGEGPGSHTGGDRVHVAILPDGMTRFVPPGGGRGESLVGFVPLGPDRHFFIMWVAKDGEEAPAGETPYGLLEALPGGRYRLYLPDCNQDRPVAVAAGAVPTAGSQPDCRFPDRAHLEAGFAAYVRHPGEAMELVPATRE